MNDHMHSPRDIGAAEDHDLTMLERRVTALKADLDNVQGAAGGDIRLLRSRVSELEDRLEVAIDRIEQLSATLTEHMKNSVILAGQVEQIARYVTAR